MTSVGKMQIDEHISYTINAKYICYYKDGHRVATYYPKIKKSSNTYIHHDVIVPIDDIKKYGLRPNHNYALKEDDWFSLEGRVNQDDIVDLLKQSYVLRSKLYIPDKGPKAIVSFPAGDTYDCVLATDVYARPINKNAPVIQTPYLIVRGKGGLSQYLYEIMTIIELNPYDKTKLNELSTEFESIKKYIYMRDQSFGFSEAPIPYRFYLLKKVYEFSPFFTPGKNLQGFVYYSLKDVGINTYRSLFNEVMDEDAYGKQINAQLAEEERSIDAYISQQELEGLDRVAVVKSRVNQGVFRERLIKKYHGCCLCGADETELLLASHIKPWAESDPKERTDVNNGLLLCPNHDRLFDKYYISFDDEGRILISDSLSEENRILFNVHEDMSIRMTDDMIKYMSYHREEKYKRSGDR